MTQQQRGAVAGLLRASPFDPAGDLREQRPLFEKMITAAPVPANVVTTPDQLGGVPAVPSAFAAPRPTASSCTSTAGSSPAARQRPRWAWPLTWPARRVCGR